MVVFGPGSFELVSVSDPFGLSLSKPGRYISAVRAELVEAVACGFGGRARVGVGGRESPGVRVTFFCFAKRKSPKKRRPPVCDPCASLRGKPASCRLRGAPWNSLCCCAAPLGQPRRVRSRSMGASTPMPPHNRPDSGAASRWLGSRTTTLAIASLGPGCAARGACARKRGPSAAQRSNGPCGCPIPLGSLQDAPRSAAASGSGLAIV